MRRKIGKWLGMLFGLIGLPLFLSSAQSFFIRDDSSALFLLLFGGVLTLAGFSQYFRFNKWEKKNFAWYKRKHPDFCDTNGRVACASCNGRHIRVRGLMQHSYTREHFCAACGTTLYYSPEG